MKLQTYSLRNKTKYMKESVRRKYEGSEVGRKRGNSREETIEVVGQEEKRASLYIDTHLEALWKEEKKVIFT